MNDTVIDYDGVDDDVPRGVSTLQSSYDNESNDDVQNDECFPELKRFRSENAKKLIIGALNINSLRNKFGAINEMLQKGYVDIFCISESKLDDSFPKSQFSSNGYQCFRQDSSARSGGLITWSRIDLPCTKRDEISINDGDIQSLVIEIRIKKEKWFVVSLYRLPNANVQSFCSNLSKILEKVFAESDMCIVLGDINIDLSVNNSKRNAFMEILTLFSMKNVINDPTCFKGAPSLIDVIAFSKPRRVSKALNYNCGLSDYHNLVAISSKVEVTKPKKRKITYRSYKHFNDEAFRNDLGSIPTSVLDVFDDISDRHWAYEQLVRSVVDQHAPFKTRYVVKQCAHMNSNLRKAIYKKRTALNRFLKNKSNDRLWEDYRKARNHYVQVNRQSMQNYFMKECEGGAQSKQFWTAVKPYFTDKGNEKRSIMLREGDDVITECRDVAQVFNGYFQEITSQTGNGDDISGLSLDQIDERYANHSSIRDIRSGAMNENDFSFAHVSVGHVRKMLSQVNAKKATGYDRLPAKVVSKASDVIAPTVTRLVNCMLDQCTFPDAMKCAEISPVFKKDDALNKSKYRPVSVLTCVSKVFEKVLNEQFSEHFYASYAEDLSAYRKNCNTQTVLLKAIDDWKLALDQGNFVGALLMDLSKAFDVIPHGLLLAKIKAYGYSNEVAMMFRSYLTNRKQRVKVDDARSEWSVMKMGVPQGSVLGPTLFNVFLNDLFFCMAGEGDSACLYNYADDNTLSYVSNSMDVLMSNMERLGSMMTTWFSSNGMKANPDKYQTITFGNKRNTPTSLTINNARIDPQDSVKLLGICIDEKLDFSQQTSSVCKKASKQVNAMMRLKSVLCEETRRHVYQAFVYSCFTYCPAVWLLCNKTNLRQLERIHCRALRFLYNDYDGSYDDLLRKGGHRSVKVLLMHSLATEVFKSLNEIGPSNMSAKFHRQEHQYHVRNEFNLMQRSFKTIKHGYNSFNYLGAKVWNHLPNEIKSSPTLAIFKKRLVNFDDASCLDRLY